MLQLLVEDHNRLLDTLGASREAGGKFPVHVGVAFASVTYAGLSRVRRPSYLSIV